MIAFWRRIAGFIHDATITGMLLAPLIYIILISVHVTIALCLFEAGDRRGRGRDLRDERLYMI